MDGKPDSPISPEKREQILGDALEVFVANGYVGTSTDQLAAAAAVSKQTLYRAFGDKQGLFAALIQVECDRIHDPFAPLVDGMHHAATAQEAVRSLAEQFAGPIMSSRIQQLRRLVIAEAARFPELGELYWERGFLRVLDSVARCLAVLDERSLLRVSDPAVAAQQLAGMLLWIPSNRTMFAGASRSVSAAEVTAGVDAFLRSFAVTA
ncbi:TetR/AcrR family transcriptional regulator [Nakamurella lactea]|uniref:TetR/AcrR family transcriptional regulator n=1 Tax=Nakamurella lactea TaxID=459515 RepID=UPI00041B13E0|nr:TetR/AcrR family transcriptional regulator [Nakamurella lactea]